MPRRARASPALIIDPAGGPEKCGLAGDGGALARRTDRLPPADVDPAVRRIVRVGVLLGVLGCGGLGHDEGPPQQAGPPDPPEEPSAAVTTAPAPPPAPGADLSPFEEAVGSRMRAVVEATVEIERWSGDQQVAHGSGVLVSAGGDVLTAAHVVDHPGDRFVVVLPGGGRRDALVTARDGARDAAMLRAPGPATAFARLAAHPPKAGDWVVCAGYGGEVPGDRVPMRSAGVVVAPWFAWTVTEYEEGTRYPKEKKTEIFPGLMRLDCATASGMSGGPVVDLDGDVVGVVVGSSGVASPIEGIRHLLPVAARPRESVAPPAPAPAIEAARGPDGIPSRDATLAPLLEAPGVERSLVELEVASARHGGARFAAVLVSPEGLAVAPAVPLAGGAHPGETVPVADVTVVGHPGARCTEIVAVRGELALLRLSGLSLSAPDGPRPVGPAGVAVLGEIVEAVGAGAVPRSTGFVTGVERHPGSVEVDPLRWGCGTVRMRHRLANPPVVVASALAHDTGWSGAGSLLVDRRGRPLALEVANRAPGLGFAVPWPEVLARFDAWLPHGR